MAIMKVIEIMAQSPDGFDAAVREAVEEASKTVKGIKSVYVNEQMAIVDDAKVVQFRVNVKVTFEVAGH